MTTNSSKTPLAQISDEIQRRHRFLLTSHARPDGDSIGSQLAMAYALRSLGKEVRLVNRDAAPAFLLEFPGVDQIEIANKVAGDFDAVLVMECSDLSRTGVEGLDRYFIINLDHHAGNRMYGAVNWFDGGASACGEMVFDLVAALGVPLTHEIATHIYLAILTDTGCFHFSNITPRTFDICRQAVEAGADPPAVARMVFDSNNLGRLKLFGAVLGRLVLDASERVAVLYLDDAMARAAGGNYDDTEGLIHLPLTVKTIEAVAFFKEIEPELYRVSLRSKGEVDVAAIAREFGGGGHRNAAGCTVRGRYDEARAAVMSRLQQAIERGATSRTER